MPDVAKILLVDDNENERFLWQEIVRSFGHEVITAASGREALERIKKEQPDLVLLDLKMPEISGLEVSRFLRQQPQTRNLPIIMLTSSDDLGDKLKGFENGVDDYVTKEMDLPEIEMRIAAVLKRYRQTMDTNPLTHLPGNNAIQNEIQKRIEAQKPFAVAYCDLDYFKAFNDAYGFIAGDKIIRFVAQVLEETIAELGNPDDFVGHIGGDDFLFLTTPQKADVLCPTILKRFENGIVQFYSPEDRERGYFYASNRQGQKQKFPIMTLSIAVVSNRLRRLESLAEISRIAGELKKLAKQKEGNVFVTDQRRDPKNI